MSRELPFSVLDVFAERPLEGNPLAVFHDARGLADADMQALARETNLSETTFVLPAADPGQDGRNGVEVRIFTTQEELPFAGHPTLGTASWLRLHHPGLAGAATVTLRLKAGPVTVSFREPRAGEPGLYGSMLQTDPVFGERFPSDEIAAVLGLKTEDMLPGVAPQSVSTGNAFCVAALQSRQGLSQLQIPQREASVWLRERGIRWFYCIAPHAERKDTWYARMQWYGGEDPATGSAAGPCIAWLVQQGLVPSGVETTLLQGLEILRPSRLQVQASLTGGRVTGVRVAGRTIPVASGRFLL